jgi:hypothetical protein
MKPSINYLAVVISAVVKFALGVLWYSPGLFGNPWMHYTGVTEQQAAESNMAVIFSGSFVLYLLQAYILAHFVHYTGSKDAKDGAQTGFWIWLGFMATVLLQGTLYERKAMALWAINAGYELLSMLVMGVILVAWRKNGATQTTSA